MKNPRFADEFTEAESVAVMHIPGPILSMGVRTVTHNRDGLALSPHKVVVIEMREGDEKAIFDLTPDLARLYSDRLRQYASIAEGKVL